MTVSEQRSVSALMSLKGRRAVVTGGAGHIGRAILDALAEVGADVCVADIDAEAVQTVAIRLSDKFGVRAFGHQFNLADENSVCALPAAVESELGGIDVLVNCAAFVGTSGLKGWSVPFPEQDFGSWRAAMEVNLTAPVQLIQACLPQLKKNCHGSVINIGSTYGVGGADWSLYTGTNMGQPGAYAASKGGLLQMTRWLATALAPDVRVNAISPGGVWRGQPEAFREKYVARTPLGRMANEEDFKGAAIFLASDLSAYVTGQNVMVDGGWTAW